MKQSVWNKFCNVGHPVELTDKLRWMFSAWRTYVYHSRKSEYQTLNPSPAAIIAALRSRMAANVARDPPPRRARPETLEQEVTMGHDKSKYLAWRPNPERQRHGDDNVQRAESAAPGGTGSPSSIIKSVTLA